MSVERRMFMFGGVFIGGLFVFADALHWFITPLAHPDASQVRVAAVGVQALLGLVAAVFAIVRAKRESGADSSPVSVS